MKRLAIMAALGASVLWTSAVLAQQSGGPAPPDQGSPGGAAAPKDLMVAPQAQPSNADQHEKQRGATSARGVPANICQELVAFLQPKPPAPAPAGAAASPPAPQAAPGAPPAQAPGAAPGAPAASPQAATAAQPGAPGSPAAQGAGPSVQASGQPAPVPQAATAPKPSMSLEDAETLARANDLRGCQEGAQKMRRAGVALPAGLLALAALKPELLSQAAAQQ
jgi:hypothetical protein